MLQQQQPAASSISAYFLWSFVFQSPSFSFYPCTRGIGNRSSWIAHTIRGKRDCQLINEVMNQSTSSSPRQGAFPHAGILEPHLEAALVRYNKNIESLPPTVPCRTLSSSGDFACVCRCADDVLTKVLKQCANTNKRYLYTVIIVDCSAGR